MPQTPKHNLEPLNLGNETLGNRIARIRKHRGLTQTELAEKIGISRKLVTDYETDRTNLTGEMLARFALALNVSADELLGLKETEFKGEGPALRYMRRVKEIEKLPDNKKKVLLQTIDSFLRGEGL